MKWELAHRKRLEETAESVVVDAPSSTEAIEDLRKSLPDDQLILYVRAVQ